MGCCPAGLISAVLGTQAAGAGDDLYGPDAAVSRAGADRRYGDGDGGGDRAGRGEEAGDVEDDCTVGGKVVIEGEATVHAAQPR